MRRITMLPLVFMAGCAGWGDKDRAAKLEDIMSGYTKTMEWSDYSRALLYRKPGNEQRTPDLSAYQNIKISDYRPGQVVSSGDKQKAQRMVQVRYIKLNRMSEHTLTTQETWEYSEKEARWYITSDLPQFPR